MKDMKMRDSRLLSIAKQCNNFYLSGKYSRPVGRYQILGGHTVNGNQILGGHNLYFTINCTRYWVGTCPCAPLALTGLST